MTTQNAKLLAFAPSFCALQGLAMAKSGWGRGLVDKSGNYKNLEARSNREDSSVV